MPKPLQFSPAPIGPQTLFKNRIVRLMQPRVFGVLNRTKVERSHRTDQQEFYQLLEYSGDVDLGQKLKTWENFYNFDRPHGAFSGKTPYEILKEKLL